GRGNRARRGDSLRTSVTISLEEAATGCTRTLEIERPEICSTCSGSGAKPGSSPEVCHYCGRRVQAVHVQGFCRVQTTCPGCRGAGKIIRVKCPDCSGSGRQMKSVKRDVKIPAGVDNDMQLCQRGEGEPGHQG